MWIPSLMTIDGTSEIDQAMKEVREMSSEAEKSACSLLDEFGACRPFKRPCPR